MKNKFWNEVSYCGAVLGLISIAFSLVAIYTPESAKIVSVILSGLNFVATIYLLFYYTKRRAAQFTEEGYTYAQCLGFMVAAGIFAGIITGAYQIVASNFFFTEYYNTLYKTMIATYAQMGMLDNNMMDTLKTTLHAYIFSPMPVLITNVLSMCLSFGFYGLFIAIATKRDADIFDSTEYEE
jgi:hypothetical protein